MNKELLEALDILEKEKEISKEVMFETIENSLLAACKNHFGKADNVKVANPIASPAILMTLCVLYFNRLRTATFR